jgi:hypothetical protein
MPSGSWRVDTLAGAGEGGAARYLYQQVFREFQEDPAVPAPLRARPPRDRPARKVPKLPRRAQGVHAVGDEYPGSCWATDARAWQAALNDLLAYEEAAARMKLQLRWREEEAAGLRLQIQQLKSIDLGLERRR